MKKLKIYHISKCIEIYKSINKVIIFSLILALFSCTLPKNSYAVKQSIRVSPIINDLQLIPGKATAIDLNIENLSNTSIGIHAEISGIDETNQGISANELSSILTKWTTITDPDIVLDPLSQKSMRIIIDPPKDAKESGYYETIFLTPIISSKKETTNPVVLSRIGVIVLGSVGILDYDDLLGKVSIEDFKPTTYVFEEKKATLTFLVENKYFTHFTAKPFLTIKPLFGQEKTVLLEERHIFPGSEKSWKVQAPLGKSIFYKAKLAVSIGEGNQILAETWFLAMPYQQILLLILAVGIIWLILFKRNRLKKAILALFGKD
jgi:hypothetical protein